MEGIAALNRLIWGGGTLLLLLGTGAFLCIRIGFLPFRFPGLIFRKTIGSLFGAKTEKGGISPFSAMSAALAGTMGVGNIVGVATAITTGGPGAVFWMWMGAFAGMSTKYGEVMLAVRYRCKDRDGAFSGGPMYYIERGMGNKPLAGIFSAACVLASFGVGNMTQSNAVSTSMSSVFGWSPILIGLVCAVLVGAVVLGGVQRITSVTSKLIPFVTILFLLGSLIVLGCTFKAVPKSLLSIFQGAFDHKAIGGGAAGTVMSRAVQIGLSRGLFTNEAGLGSAPIAHACADTREPCEQGLWGIFEVFADTLVVCTITALVILSTSAHTTGLWGAQVTTYAFAQVFGRAGEGFVALSIGVFAVASIISWNLYGQRAIYYLFDGSKKGISLYSWVYTLAVLMGAVTRMDVVWELADLFNGLMMLPNLCSLLWLSPQIAAATKEYGRFEGKKPQGRGKRFPHKNGAQGTS